MIRVGIDLGSTNTVCCYFNPETGLKTLNFNAQPTLPSVLLYENSKVVIGKNAKQKAIIKNQRYIESSKTYMGSTEPLKVIDGRKFTPTDVATEILKEVKKAVIEQLGSKEEEEIEAVITVPAYFQTKQKEETRKAGEQAGMKVIGINHEPSAAAISYSTETPYFKNIYVIDIGGGTFDVALIENTGKDVYDEKRVSGDQRLGGDDFNDVIFRMITDNIYENSGVDLSSYDECSMAIVDEATYLSLRQMLKATAENVKIQLTAFQEWDIAIPALFVNSLTNQAFSLNYTITRSDFEDAASYLFNRIETIIEESFSNPEINIENYDKNSVEHILFMGGSSVIPKISEIVYKIFGRQAERSVDTAKGVAIGAALLAYKSINEKTGLIREVLAHSLGTSYNSCYGIDNPFIGGVPGCFSEILKRGSTYPVSGSDVFSTSVDNMTTMCIDVIEGNDKYSINNTYYGEFNVENLTQRPRGLTKVKVTYSIDRDGILHIDAYEIDGNSNGSIIDKQIEIKNAKNNPDRINFRKKYRNIFLFNTDISHASENNSMNFWDDYNSAIMNAVYYKLCLFDNPSTLAYNGSCFDFTTDQGEFQKHFADYFQSNTKGSNYSKLNENIKAINQIMNSSDFEYNVFVISDNGTDISGRITSKSKVNVYYIDYCFETKDSKRKYINSIRDLSFQMYLICKTNLWEKDVQYYVESFCKIWQI